MHEIVVCSGKGGTGKTSVVASFAALAHEPVLADCDVDAADLHLVLDPQIQQRDVFFAGKEARIREEDCIACGTCQDLCQFEAIDFERLPDNSCRFSVNPLGCEGCGVCVRFCPNTAIEFEERRCGEWYISETRYGPLVHARLGIAAENSGKLVTHVRTEARRIAERHERDLLLVDGPPGIGCPVIASLTNADEALAVTEPTVSGLHDLERLAGMTAHFGIELRVCINKCDLDDSFTRRIHEFSAREKLTVVGEIPYDPQVTAAQIAGVPVVELGDSPAAVALREVWQRILN